MCIFSGSVKDVSKTNILVSKVFPAKIINTRDNTGRVRRFKKPSGNPLQLTIYQNSVQLSRNPMDAQGRPNTAMILPFPIKPNVKNRVRILSMEQYEGLFEDLNSIFPPSNSGTVYSLNSSQPLEVFNIGSYQASLVPNLSSFDKLQYDKFNMSSDVKQLLKQYYSRDFGFVVCILKNNAKFHPFAYVHELRSDGKLFVPTRHFHGTSSGQYISNSSFSRFHEPGIQDILNLSDSMIETDYPLESDIGVQSSSVGSTRDNSVDDYYHDVLMTEDKWIKHQVKRRDVEIVHDRAVVDWDHNIYIINHPTALRSSLLKQPGIIVSFPDKQKLSHLDDYIIMNSFPREISFGGIRGLFKISIKQLYQGNHDLFI